MAFVVVQRNPNAAVFRQQFAQQFQARIHHVQPQAVFQIVIVMRKCRTRVIGWVYENTFDAACIKRQQRFQRVQIVALNNQIIISCLIFN